MEPWKVWLTALGKAVWDEAAGSVEQPKPFGDQMPAIARRFGTLLATHLATPDQQRQAAEQVTTVDPAALLAHAQAVAEEVARGHPAGVQQTLAWTLAQAPNAARRSLRQPTGLHADQPGNLVGFLPVAPPRVQFERMNLGSWKLLAPLGLGGFAEVWLGQNSGKKAAFKFFLDSQARRLLAQHEADVALRLEGVGELAGIVRLDDLATQADPPWLRYEYVAGGDLLANATKFFGAGATPFIIEVARILGKCHRLARPVVHRDLKPGNILLRVEGDRLRPLIADFGIGGVAAAWARAVDGDAPLATLAALPTMLLGSHTALYASPQQSAGADADPRDDVYSLGVLWYQLLVGNLLSGRPAGNWQRKLTMLTPALLDLLGDCCDDDPSQRPADAHALAERMASASAKVTVPVRVQPVAGETLTTRLGIRLAYIPAGSFWMGSPDRERGRDKDERRHRVTLTQPYYLGVYPVTVGEFAHFVAATGYRTAAEQRAGAFGLVNNTWKYDTSINWRTPGFAQTERHPVTCVDYADALALVNWLNDTERAAGLVYALPTAAQWEHACRAGTETAYWWGDDAAKLGDHAWFLDNAKSRTHPVETRKANPWGLWHMHGHVQEWCGDWYGEYPTEGATDPVGVFTGTTRETRGGSWGTAAEYARAARRIAIDPTSRFTYGGIRVAVRAG